DGFVVDEDVGDPAGLTLLRGVASRKGRQQQEIEEENPSECRRRGRSFGGEPMGAGLRWF
ncbi:MAG: hypothetical protein KAJ42_08765, partial [Gemmatimonadetes bacterium]|nr:hypothetical protein [Gemmatimonadota bacterium]